MDGSGAHAGSVETRTSWVVAIAALIVLSVSYGAPLTTVVALKPIAAEFGATRSAPALAVALTFIGAGCGGIAMGWLAERIGVRAVVIFGGTMIGAGLTISSLGGLTQLYISSFLLVGLLGAAGMFAPLMTYVSRWFDVRRGTAIALISAGQYIAGALWPPLFQFGIDAIGWRHTMLAYAVFVVVVILPLAAIFLRRAAGCGGVRRRRCRTAGRRAGPRSAAQPGAGGTGVRHLLLLRDDVDADGAHGGVLQRYRHRAHAGRGDAVGAARFGVLRTAVLGLAGGPRSAACAPSCGPPRHRPRRWPGSW